MADEEFTDNELDNLTEEEALALQDDDSDDDSAQDDADTGEQDGDEQDGDVAAEAEDSESEEAAADDDVDDDSEDGGQADVVADSEDQADEPSDDQGGDSDEAKPDAIQETAPLNEQLQAVDEAIDALGEKIENGDIDFKEYNSELSRLNRQRQDLVVDIRDERNARTRRANNWNQAVDEFVSADEGHKKILTSPIVKQAFETALREVATSAEGARQTDAWRLNKAKERLAEEGIVLGAAMPKPKDKKSQPKSRHPDVGMPKTLGNLPKAGDNDQSEFSHLASLDGMDLEAALAKLTPEQEARYLGG